MDENAIWSAIDDHRLRLIALLEDLSDEEWRAPSLCPGWTVRDVAAHLTMAQTSIGELLIVLIKIRGDLNTKILDSARLRAADWSTDKIIQAIRAMVGSRRHNPGSAAGRP